MNLLFRIKYTARYHRGFGMRCSAPRSRPAISNAKFKLLITQPHAAAIRLLLQALQVLLVRT